MLTVHGSSFTQSSLSYTGSQVYWNATPLTTTYDSSLQLRVTVPAADLLQAGSAQVTVRNVTDGTLSNAMPFTIVAGPVITSLDPPSASAGSGAFMLTVHGNSFTQDSLSSG